MGLYNGSKVYTSLGVCVFSLCALLVVYMIDRRVLSLVCEVESCIYNDRVESWCVCILLALCSRGEFHGSLRRDRTASGSDNRPKVSSTACTSIHSY